MGETAINLLDIHLSFGERTLFDGIRLGVHVGEKIGLIGDNGSGKSTLLRIIAGDQIPESGVVEVQGGLRIATLEQSPNLPAGKTGREVLEDGLRPLLDTIAAYEEAAAAVDPDADRLLAEIERLGGWDWDHRLRRAADEVGVEDLDASVDIMSGGQRKRIALARLRLSDADIIMLDEPTNHLDHATVEAMEDWLRTTSATVLVITHDRFFLEAVVTRIVELRRGQLSAYVGGYADYLEARAEEEEQRSRVRHRRLQVLKVEIEWARRSPKARTTKAKARLGRIDGLHDQQDALKEGAKTSQIRFGDGPRLGKTILELHEISKGFPPEDPSAPHVRLIHDFTLRMRPGQRLGVVGPNGCGKTTLLRLILGEIAPDSGQIELGKNTRPAYFDQLRVELDLSKSLRETLVGGSGDHVFPGGHKTHVSSWLKRFAFDSRLHGMAVEKLSGGERNRLAIARFLLSDANLLLLDEPTNDLDLLTLNLFEEALLEFQGCVLVVSHDRFFLDKICTGILGFTGPSSGGEVLHQEGGYTAYQDYLSERAAKATAAPPKGGPHETAAAPTPKKAGLTYKEKRELEGVEQRIAAADELVARLTKAYADPGLWTEGSTRGVDVKAELEAATSAAEAIYERWAELSERAEEL